MAAGKSAAFTKPPAQRKRNRKRKRRVASDSSSSSSDTDSSSDESTQPAALKITQSSAAPKIQATKPFSSSSSSTAGSSSESSSESSDDEQTDEDVEMSVTEVVETSELSTEKARKTRAPSSSPPPAAIAPFLPDPGSANLEVTEQELKERFRKFWMGSVADGFRDDLEQIRKESNMNPSRLGMLIDSLASGAEVFSSKSGPNVPSEINVALGNPSRS